ncbi:hypothetical protein B0O79_0098 [Flavobacteriaceae bacterium MAR_2009_75]|nr:hypothetical protein B0O79_0098 [Flavobacteriaceae bacterium MAR_2009_75]
MKKHCTFYHEFIETQHVFAENQQVYLKSKTYKNGMTLEEWSPINFQWNSVMQL